MEGQRDPEQSPLEPFERKIDKKNCDKLSRKLKLKEETKVFASVHIRNGSTFSFFFPLERFSTHSQSYSSNTFSLSVAFNDQTTQSASSECQHRPCQWCTSNNLKHQTVELTQHFGQITMTQTIKRSRPPKASWTFLKTSLSHKLFLLMTPRRSSLSFEFKAIRKSIFLIGELLISLLILS